MNDLQRIQRIDRIEELLAKIPRGTVCTEDNHCGGFLTEAEERELNELFQQRDS